MAILMKYETIDASQIDTIMEGKEPGPPQDWSNGDSGDSSSSGGSAPRASKEKSTDDKKADLSDPASLH